MTPIFGWQIKRAGSAMTITHMGGKITNVESVEPKRIDGEIHIVAIKEGGQRFSLQPDA